MGDSRDARRTLALVGLAAAMLAAALYGPRHGGPEPVVMTVIMIVSLVAGIAGIAFSALCCAILLPLASSPMHVVQLVALCSFANQIVTVWGLRRQIAWRDLGGAILGGWAGVGPGLWTLLHVEPHKVAQAIGTVLLAYAAHLLFGRTPVLRVRSRWADAAIGFVASATGAVSTLPSLPLTIWCQARGLDKDRLRATVQPFVLAMQVVTVPLLAHSAPESAIGPADLLCLPSSLFGTLVGLDCVRGLSNRHFAITVALLLVVCGVDLWL